MIISILMLLNVIAGVINFIYISKNRNDQQAAVNSLYASIVIIAVCVVLGAVK